MILVASNIAGHAAANFAGRMRERDKNESNWEEVDSAILTVEKEVSRLAKMKTWTETIQSNSGNILEEIRKGTNSLERQIAVLRESVETPKHS